MYSIDDLKTAVRRPRTILREINRLYYTRLRSRDFNTSAPNVFDRDWDNLLLLDACRYDVFERKVSELGMTGELSVTLSRGSKTPEFLAGNFAEKDLSDTVYVTGSSMFYRQTVLNDEFDHNLHAVVDVWEESDFEDGSAGPERIVTATRRAAQKFPNKRLLVHFIQPHIPFIGEFGVRKFGDDGGQIWKKKRRNELDATDEELWRAYAENLECVLSAVLELLDDLSGKTVVSSDHGQLIGERVFPIPFKEYGHPVGIYCSELVEVPWFVVENGTRKRVVPEPPESEYTEKERSEMNEEARELLRELGYVEESR